MTTGEDAEARVGTSDAFKTKGGIQDLRPSEPQALEMTWVVWGRLDGFDIVTLIRIAVDKICKCPWSYIEEVM